MKSVTFPNTDLRVSNISLGTSALGTIISPVDSFTLLDACCAADLTLSPAQLGYLASGQATNKI